MVTPKWTTSRWFNTARPLTLEDFSGRVVVLEAFQMLCPGCVAHGLPLLKRIESTFAVEDVAVVGLHSVFEHHDAQGTDTALAAFIDEYRLTFPIAVDAQRSGSRLPATMADYEMRGTPTLVLFDRDGKRRRQYFGAVADLEIGAEIAALVGKPARAMSVDVESADVIRCSPDGCALPA